MSTTISTAFVNNYHGQLEMKFQQHGSRIRPYVDEVPQNGEFDYYDQLGTATAVQLTTRHGDTRIDDITHTRRRLQATTWNNAFLIDTADKLQTLIDPRSGYAMSQAMALGRAQDDSIIAAATGTAYTGKTGSTATIYDTNYQIASTYHEDGSTAAANLTIGKLRRARYLLDVNDAVMDGESVVCVVGASEIQSLLRTTEVTSADYAAVKALVNGEVDTFLGFKFIRTNRLAVSSGVRNCLAFPKSAIKFGVAEDIITKIDELPGKNYSVQVYSESRFGAVRMWEEKVISILCDEAVLI